MTDKSGDDGYDKRALDQKVTEHPFFGCDADNPKPVEDVMAELRGIGLDPGFRRDDRLFASKTGICLQALTFTGAKWFKSVIRL